MLSIFFGVGLAINAKTIPKLVVTVLGIVIQVFAYLSIIYAQKKRDPRFYFPYLILQVCPFLHLKSDKPATSLMHKTAFRIRIITFNFKAFVLVMEAILVLALFLLAIGILSVADGMFI